MTDRLRVSFCLLNNGIGGTELNAVRTAERLNRDRFDLEIIALSDFRPLRARYERAGIPFHVLPLRSLKSLHALRLAGQLVRHLKERGTHVLHAHDTYGNLLGVPCGKFARTPAVIASRRWWKSRFQPGHKLGNRCMFRWADGVVANTPAVVELTVREGVAREKIHLVPNFLDEESYQPPSTSVAAFRQELGIPENTVVIGVIAQLRPEKDHSLLIRAAAKLRQRHPEAHFVLVGEGPCRAEIESLRENLGLRDRVHLAGLQMGRGNLHHAFDISVLCSQSEALSNSLLEAMAAGKPVVASEVGGNSDAVSHGETGLLFPVGDLEALVEALQTLLRSPARCRRLGEAGRYRARLMYTPETAIDALEAVYTSALASTDPISASEGAAA